MLPNNGAVQKHVLKRISNDNVPVSRSLLAHPGVYLLAAAPAMFGSLHATARDFEFPSATERILWRAATVTATASPFLGLLTIPLAQWTRSSGNAQSFVADCMRLLREYSWHEPDATWVDEVYDRLQRILVQDPKAKTSQTAYRDIFCPENDMDYAGKLLKLFERNPVLKFEDQTFLASLERLVRVLSGRHGSKKLSDEAAIPVWPRVNELPSRSNKGIISATGILYILFRIVLLGVAFSSRRHMPDWVYNETPWAKDIPTFGAK